MENFELLKAIFLGLIEGLTEFLPISSTGHLILFGHLIDFHSDSGRVFEVVIQLGAILAVCWLYRQKIIELVKGFFSGDAGARRFAINVLVAFFPAVIIGVLAVDFIKQVLFSPIVVACALIIGGLISSLFLTLIIVPVMYQWFDNILHFFKLDKKGAPIDELIVEKYDHKDVHEYDMKH